MGNEIGKGRKKKDGEVDRRKSKKEKQENKKIINQEK